MRKNGNKIFAILLTAVCLIGVLPLSVVGATETIYVPAVASITEGYRPSVSANGLTADRNYNSVTIPIPLFIGESVNITIPNSGSFYAAVLVLDDSYTVIRSFSTTASGTIVIQSSQLSQAGFVQIGYSSQVEIGGTIIIDNVETNVLQGQPTIAHRERYELIEVPDPPTPPSETNIANDILTMWQQFLVQNLEALGLYYEELVVPIALIIGIPICIAIIGIILTLIGGKKR